MFDWRSAKCRGGNARQELLMLRDPRFMAREVQMHPLPADLYPDERSRALQTFSSFTQA